MNYLTFVSATKTAAKVIVQRSDPIEIDSTVSANHTVLVTAKHRRDIGHSPGVAPCSIERIDGNPSRVGGIAGIVRVPTVDDRGLHCSRIEREALGEVAKVMLATVLAVLRWRGGLVFENRMKLSGAWREREVYLVILKV